MLRNGTPPRSALPAGIPGIAADAAMLALAGIMLTGALGCPRGGSGGGPAGGPPRGTASSAAPGGVLAGIGGVTGGAGSTGASGSSGASGASGSSGASGASGSSGASGASGSSGASGASGSSGSTAPSATTPRSNLAGRGGPQSSTSTAGPSSAAAGAPGGGGPWAPPIGIPEPPIGVREVAPARPAPWVAETPGFFYVDMHHAAASDARALGTPAAPRRTIPATLAAGDVVEVHGVYDHAPMGYSRVSGAGNAARPIFIRGRSAAERPTIRRDLHVVGSYMILEHLAFADHDGTIAGQPVLLAPAHHVALRDCDISGNPSAGGLLITSWSTDRGHDIVVLRNVIHDNGDWRTALDQDKHGIGLGNVDHVWILDNELTRNSGDGLQINAGSLAAQPRTHHIYVGRNDSHHNKQSGMWTKQAVDVVFSQNRVRAHRPSGSSPGGGMGFQYAPERVWFIANDISDCEIGIYLGSDSGLGSGTSAWILGNVIHDIHHTAASYDAATAWAPAAITAAGGRALSIIDNTIHDVDAGIHTPLHGAALRIEGNIISRVTLGSHVFVEDGATAAASLLARGVLEGPVRLRWGSTTPRDLAALRAAFPSCEQGSLSATPHFADAAAGDFRLAPGSPGIDTSGAADAYARFRALYGIDIALDHRGGPRPRGAGWDCGAHERP